MIPNNQSKGKFKGRSPTLLSKSDPVKSAEAFLGARKRPLIYYRGDFYSWRAGRYESLSVSQIRSELYTFLGKAIEGVKVKNPDGTVDWQSEGFKPTSRAVSDLLDALQHHRKVFVPETVNAPAWLKHSACKPDPEMLVSMQNGILNLTTGRLLKHTPDLLTMVALPYDFDPNAECPRWEQFAAELFPDENMRREFQKVCGYLLSSDRSHHKIFLFKGPKRAGKGTTIRTLTKLLGQANVVSGMKLRQLGKDFGQAVLVNKKVAFFPDERLDRKVSGLVETLLSISGEDGVSIARKWREDWVGTLPTRLFIATNVTPRFEDASAVIASRFIVFQLTRSFAENPERDLDEKLAAELPGILNWALEGLRMLREDGRFNQPEEGQSVVDTMEDVNAAVKMHRRAGVKMHQRMSA